MDRMRQFEQAANEIDNDVYTGSSSQENCIEWISGNKTATVTFPKGKYATRVKKLAEKYPDEVTICHENKNGTIVAHIPVSYVRINKPKQMNYTEDQKEVMRERAKQMFHKTSNA